MRITHSGAAALAAALFVSAACVLPHVARAAAQFSATPLLLTLPADKRATSLLLGNQGAAPVTVQAELVTWSQESGEDAYAPTRELLVSPPVFSMAPRAQQVVRVGRVKAGTAPAREVAYRLKVTEVPPAGSGKAGSVASVMQLSFPVFVPPAGGAKPQLEGVAEQAGAAGLAVKLTNSGAVHDRVVGLRVEQDNKTLAEHPLNYYVLAGVQRRLEVANALQTAQPGPVEIHLQLEGHNRGLRLTLNRTP